MLEPPSDHPEEQWPALLAQNDHDTMARVFRKYFSRLASFARSITGNTQEAEDLAIQSLSTLWERARAGATIDRIESYLFTIARNACYDYLKHEQVKKKSAPTLADQQPFENIIEAALIKEDIIEKIFLEIRSLPGKCRQVTEMIYLHGLSTEEVAEALHITPSTVRSQKARALELLKTTLVKNRLLLLLPAWLGSIAADTLLFFSNQV